jgi:hypothetical protein
MTDKGISLLARDFQEYRSQLEKFTRLFYPNILGDLNDASIGSWLLDLQSAIASNLSFYVDRAYQETQIDAAQLRRSLLAIARTRGVKIPGNRASLCEVEISCIVPLNGQDPDPNYMPIIRRGTQSQGAGQTFELLNDCDFKNQFDENGISNRTIQPSRDSNGNINGYLITKREIMASCTTKIYKQVLYDNVIKPFFEIVLPDQNVICVESIITKEGESYNYTPNAQDFSLNSEYIPSANTYDGRDTWRFFEVDSLLRDKIFLPDNIEVPGDYPVVDRIADDVLCVVKGGWRYLKQKFITEYTDLNFLKIIFGAGDVYDFNSQAPTPAEKEISRLVNNFNMGVLPRPGHTMWVRYKTGGGESSNIAAGVLNSFAYQDITISGDGTSNSTDGSKINSVYRTLRIRNTSPSYGGKSAPTNEELRYMIKYNNMGKMACSTVKDYEYRLTQMPGVYGVPFRSSVIEKNNIIYINLLGVDNSGHLVSALPSVMIDNIANYLSEYKSTGDYVIPKPGMIINLQVECDIIVKKAFNNNDVVQNVISTTYDFFDINKRQMGENLYISQLVKNILDIGGVNNLIEIRVYNIFKGNYSTDRISQPVMTGSYNEEGIWEPAQDSQSRVQVNLTASDNILFSNADSMYEIYDRNIDIKVRVKNM